MGYVRIIMEATKKWLQLQWEFTQLRGGSKKTAAATFAAPFSRFIQNVVLLFPWNFYNTELSNDTNI